MKHLDEIERFVNLVEKISGLYGVTPMKAHDYALNYLKGNIQMDKEQLEKSRDKKDCTSKPSQESECCKEGSYRKALETIASETSCDDTWDYANRVLNGDGDTELSYRMGNN